MKIYLQEFVTKIRHIAGSSNKVADYMSRVELRDSPSVNLCYLLNMNDIKELRLGVRDDLQSSSASMETFESYLSLISTIGRLDCSCCDHCMNLLLSSSLLLITFAPSRSEPLLLGAGDDPPPRLPSSRR